MTLADFWFLIAAASWAAFAALAGAYWRQGLMIAGQHHRLLWAVREMEMAQDDLDYALRQIAELEARDETPL